MPVPIDWNRRVLASRTRHAGTVGGKDSREGHSVRDGPQTNVANHGGICGAKRETMTLRTPIPGEFQRKLQGMTLVSHLGIGGSIPTRTCGHGRPFAQEREAYVATSSTSKRAPAALAASPASESQAASTEYPRRAHPRGGQLAILLWDEFVGHSVFLLLVVLGYDSASGEAIPARAVIRSDHKHRQWLRPHRPIGKGKHKDIHPRPSYFAQPNTTPLARKGKSYDRNGRFLRPQRGNQHRFNQV